MVYSETLSKGYGDRMGIERVLFDAIFTGRFKYLRRLLDAGFNPNVVDDNRMSLLTHACLIENHLQRQSLVKLLLDHGAVADKRDNFDMDSVMHATLAAHCDIIQLLIDHCSDDIDVRHLSTEGYPILSMAVISQDLATVQKIYQLHRRLGVHVDDVTNEEGITPYMEAVRRDYTEIAEFLRIVGKASPLRVSHNGRTVAEVTAEFQKDKNDRIEAKIREMRMINPPRYSEIHPEISRLPVASGGGKNFLDRHRSKSVSFLASREDTRVTFDSEHILLPVQSRQHFPYNTSSANNHLRLSFGKFQIFRNPEFVHTFQPRAREIKSEAKLAALQNAKDTKSISNDNVHEAFERQSEKHSDLLRPNFTNEHVTLDSRELALMKKADRKVKRRQQRANKSSGSGGHHGYNIVIPQDIQKLFSSQKEKSFTLRRPSEVRVGSQVDD